MMSVDCEHFLELFESADCLGSGARLTESTKAQYRTYLIELILRVFQCRREVRDDESPRHR